MKRSARPSGFPRQSATIGGLMTIVAIVAFWAWMFKTSASEGFVLLLLPLAVVYPFLAGPLIVKWKQWIGAEPRFDPIDPDLQETPQTVADSIAETIPDLEGLGFRCLGHFRNVGTSPNAAAYVTLFEDPEARRTAQLFTVFAASGLARQVVTVLAFKTQFDDGTWLTTANSRVVSLFPPRSHRREGSISFPWIQSPQDLYEIHQASVAYFAPDGRPSPPQIMSPVDFLEASVRQEHDGFVEVGYVYLDESRRRYRYTWKGAILGAWKLTWPIKSIRQWLRRREALRILRELDLEYLAP